MNQVASQTQGQTKASLLPGSDILQRKCACGNHTVTGGECADCRQKRTAATLQRTATSTSPGPGVPPIVHDVLRSPGQPLDAGTRAFMGPHFGRDFSKVQVHTDAKAAESARAVDALAYTVGRSVVFGAGQYAPRSNAGQQLIAHELTHVLQQSNGAVSDRALSRSMGVSDPNDSLERQADETAFRLFSCATSGIGDNSLRPLHLGVENTIQRKATQQARASVPSSRGAPIVEDSQRTGPGQMRRSEFLTTLRDELIQACDIEFASVGRTARECPYILRTIERYATRPLSSMMRLIQAFARPPAGADARGLITSVTERTRVVARRIGERQGPRAQAVTENRDTVLPSHDPVSIRAQLGNGRALEGHTRERMEGSFGTSFAPVRIHEDSTAARFNTALKARAFTVGQNIAFAAGQYRPGTPPGDLLIAHELAHTVQQGSGRPRTSSGSADQELERQAERAAVAAVAGHDLGTASLRLDESGIQIQRAPAVLAAGLIIAEATPEVVVIAEIATVSTEIVVTDGALVVAADVGAPTLLELAAPTVLETAAPVLESALPAALESTAATSSALSTSAATVGVGVAATTLSSDSPTEEEQQSNDCAHVHPDYPLCTDFRSRETVAESYANSHGIQVQSLNCYGRSSMPSISHCGNGPGENWHCEVNNSAYVVSLFKCHCCRPGGSVGEMWVPHQSLGNEDNSAQRRQDTRRDRREQDERARRRRRDRDDE